MYKLAFCLYTSLTSVLKMCEWGSWGSSASGLLTGYLGIQDHGWWCVSQGDSGLVAAGLTLTKVHICVWSYTCITHPHQNHQVGKASLYCLQILVSKILSSWKERVARSLFWLSYFLDPLSPPLIRACSYERGWWTIQISATWCECKKIHYLSHWQLLCIKYHH